MSHPINEDKIEAYQEHIEGGQHEIDDVKANDTFALTKSRFDQLGLWRTLWVFRTASIYCLLVYTGFLCEGFEVSIILLSGTRLIFSFKLVDRSLPTLDS